MKLRTIDDCNCGHALAVLKRGFPEKNESFWAWRIWLEPRRLFWRYLTTNPRPRYLLFNKSRTPGN